jgi:hypothetical protein
MLADELGAGRLPSLRIERAARPALTSWSQYSLFFTFSDGMTHEYLLLPMECQWKFRAIR